MSVKWLSKTAILTAEEVGLKAMKFLRLVKGGLPVPTGFCLTGGSFESYLRDSKTADFIVSQLFFGKEEDTSKLSNQISWLISNSRLKESVLADILENYESLGVLERKGLKVEDLIWTGKETNVSIRPSLNDSSITISFPNINCIKGIKNIERGIMLLYASMFSKEALEYIKAKQKIPNVAVLIQQTIIPKKAGFCSYKRGEAVKIYSNFGASDSIKNGEVFPDLFEVDQNSFKIVGRKISSKNVAYLFDKTDGTIKRISVPLSGRGEESLATTEISRVYNTCQLLREVVGDNFSFEWAMNDYGIWILNYEVKEVEEQDVFQMIGRSDREKEQKDDDSNPEGYNATIEDNTEKEPEKIRIFQDDKNGLNPIEQTPNFGEASVPNGDSSVQNKGAKSMEFNGELSLAFQKAIDKFSRINPHLKDILLLFEEEVKENLKK